MKPIVISFLIIILLISCNIVQTSKSSEGLSCRKFEKFIKTVWKENQKAEIFDITTKDLDFLLKHKSCLCLNNKDEFIALFGKPNINQGNVLKYYLNKDCNKKGRRRCKLLQVRIDNATKVVTDIQVSSFTVHH